MARSKENRKHCVQKVSKEARRVVWKNTGKRESGQVVKSFIYSDLQFIGELSWISKESSIFFPLPRLFKWKQI